MNIAKVVRLKDGEIVVRVMRRYWVTLLPHILLALLLVYAPFFFLVPLMSVGAWGLVVLGLSVAAGVLFAVHFIHVWRWNAFVVTSHRIVDIDQRGFFERVVSEAPFDRIQDVSYRIHGFLGAILGYGTITLQTAGTTVQLELHGVGNPREVHHLITEQMHRRAGHGDGTARSAKVAALLESASDMTDTEARAFVIALQEAMKDKKQAGWSTKDIEDLYDRRDPA
jgi:membrane protein YdbS with pleckstrin-like domain